MGGYPYLEFKVWLNDHARHTFIYNENTDTYWCGDCNSVADFRLETLATGVRYIIHTDQNHAYHGTLIGVMTGKNGRVTVFFENDFGSIGYTINEKIWFEEI